MNGLKDIRNGRMKTKNDKLNAINSERFVNYMWYSPKQWREWKARGKNHKKTLTLNKNCDIGFENEDIQNPLVRSGNIRGTSNKKRK